MNNNGSPPPKRKRLSGEELSKINKDEIIDLYIKQQDLLDKDRRKTSETEKDVNGKCKTPMADTSRRENVLMMRLATKEQELQQYAAQITHIKKSQEDHAAKSLREAMLDPAVNLLFNKMKDELKETKDKLEQAQSELSAWKFTPDSQTGKKLMSRCRTLIAENQELGRQLSQGKVAQLEAELALQKKYSEELKESQEELNEFVIQLDEEVEGMQSTIQLLQQQLVDSKKELGNYKKMKGNTDLMVSGRTKERVMDINMKIEGEVLTQDDVDIGDVKEEVGENNNFEPQNGEESPSGRSFENSEFVCKEECGSDGENENPMEVDGLKYRNEKEGERTPTYSEHEIIDESQDSTPGCTPERIFSDNGAANYAVTECADTTGHEDTPIIDETYAIIDNGSDDETHHIAQIVSTNDAEGLCKESNTKPSTGVFETAPTESLAGNISELNAQHDTSTAPQTHSEVIETHVGMSENIVDTSTTENGLPHASELRTNRLTEPVNDVPAESSLPVVDRSELNTDNAQDDVILIERTEKAAIEEVSEMREAPQHPVTRTDARIRPHTTLPPLAHSLMSHSLPQHVPLMGDSASYVMNPHFQHMQETAMAQQQALMADLMYKSMLAQQQQQLVMVEDKNHLPDGSNALRTGDEQRTNINPLMHGLPYADPQAAFMAQYKAMLAAQQMFMPVADGKTPQMLAPGGLGLYPGIPSLVQPTVMPQASTDHVTNGVTNVTYAPHPLMAQGFLGASPAGLILYPGHNMTPHSVAAPTPVDMDKHHGSGDHGPLPNGFLAQKTTDVSDTNSKEDPHIVA